MKRTLSILFSIMISTLLPAQNEVTYTKADSIRIESLLREADDIPADVNPVLYFARKFIDIPYVAHTLEVNSSEKLVVNTRQLDCLTLVENASALAICHNNNLKGFEDFCNVLRFMRYRGGVTDGYASRIHYFSEWIKDNKAKGLVDNIAWSSEPFNAMEHVNVWFMGKYPEKYKMLKGRKDDIEKIREVEKRINATDFRYISKKDIRDNAIMRNTVHDGDILAIVTSHAGLDIAHVGIAVWHKDGLHLLNASSIHHKVVEEPMTLYQYMQKHPSQKGIRVVRVM